MAQIPSTLEPAGLSRSDGKRSDGVTIAPWKSGHPLVWDVTCLDTYETSYELQATSEAGAVTALAEWETTSFTRLQIKHIYFASLLSRHQVSLAQLPQQYYVTWLVKSKMYLTTKLKDIPVPKNLLRCRGNAASVMGCAGLDLDAM